jgi:diguanylate cyclase (GGDEF)-like protein
MDNATTNSRLHGVLGNLGKLTSIRDTELLEQSLLRTLGPLLGVLDTELYRLDDDQTIVRAIYSHRSRVIDGDGEARMVERIEEVVRPGDLPEEVVSLAGNVRLLGRPCSRRVDDLVMTAYPLLGDQEVCGYFMFRRDREPSPTEDTIIRGVLEVFSNYYALLDVSLRDRLTGLFNRQALENSFDRIWSAISRADTLFEPGRGRRTAPCHRYWLAMIDIDRFKQINDSFGHMVGDEILLLTARLMAGALRGSDLLYRYGGEEFVAIVAAENDDIARNVFERLRLAIEAHHFPQADRVTISIGYTEVRPELLPVEVLSRADRSLYQAKQDGRNIIYDYPTLVAEGVFKETVYQEPELF